MRGDEIAIKKNLKIDASALEDGVVVDAVDASRAFIVLGKFNANTGSTNGYANVTINNVAIMNGNATVYYFANDDRIAKESSDGRYWYLVDHLGSTNVMIDSTGTLVER